MRTAELEAVTHGYASLYDALEKCEALAEMSKVFNKDLSGETHEERTQEMLARIGEMDGLVEVANLFLAISTSSNLSALQAALPVLSNVSLLSEIRGGEIEVVETVDGAAAFSNFEAAVQVCFDFCCYRLPPRRRLYDYIELYRRRYGGQTVDRPVERVDLVFDRLVDVVHESSCSSDKLLSILESVYDDFELQLRTGKPFRLAQARLAKEFADVTGTAPHFANGFAKSAESDGGQPNRRFASTNRALSLLREGLKIDGVVERTGLSADNVRQIKKRYSDEL